MAVEAVARVDVEARSLTRKVGSAVIELAEHQERDIQLVLDKAELWCLVYGLDIYLSVTTNQTMGLALKAKVYADLLALEDTDDYTPVTREDFDAAAA